MNQTILIEEVLKNSKKFIADVRVWDDYPKDPAYYALAAFLEKVVIPSLEASRKPTRVAFAINTTPERKPCRRGSNTIVTNLRGE